MVFNKKKIAWTKYKPLYWSGIRVFIFFMTSAFLFVKYINSNCVLWNHNLLTPFRSAQYNKIWKKTAENRIVLHDIPILDKLLYIRLSFKEEINEMWSVYLKIVILTLTWNWYRIVTMDMRTNKKKKYPNIFHFKYSICMLFANMCDVYAWIVIIGFHSRVRISACIFYVGNWTYFPSNNS